MQYAIYRFFEDVLYDKKYDNCKGIIWICNFI